MPSFQPIGLADFSLRPRYGSGPFPIVAFVKSVDFTAIGSGYWYGLTPEAELSLRYEWRAD